MPYVLSESEYQEFTQMRDWYRAFRGVNVTNRPGVGPTIGRDSQSRHRRPSGGRGGQLPTGEYVGQGLRTVAQGTNGFEFEEMHPMIGVP
jgi:hypothetical protein